MTGCPPEILEGLVKLHSIAEAYADVSLLEETVPLMRLSPVLTPVVQLPTKPPPARAQYYPGMVGSAVPAVALNFSNVGIFNREDLSRVIVEVYGVTITNVAGVAVTFHLRRDDQPVQSGHTFSASVPAYSDAGASAQPALGMNVANNNIAAPGVLMGTVDVPANDTMTFPFEGIINNGQFLVTGSVVNLAVIAAWWFRIFPIIQVQRPG